MVPAASPKTSTVLGLAVFSESTKGPEEDRWKTPPDRSFEGRTPSGASPGGLLVACCAPETKALTSAKLRCPDPIVVAGLLQLRFKSNCARRTDAAP